MRREVEVKQALGHSKWMEEHAVNDASREQFKGRVDALAWVLGEEEPTLNRTENRPHGGDGLEHLRRIPSDGDLTHWTREALVSYLGALRDDACASNRPDSEPSSNPDEGGEPDE